MEKREGRKEEKGVDDERPKQMPEVAQRKERKHGLLLTKGKKACKERRLKN